MFFAMAGLVFVGLRAFGGEGGDGLLGDGDNGVVSGWSGGRGGGLR